MLSAHLPFVCFANKTRTQPNPNEGIIITLQFHCKKVSFLYLFIYLLPFLYRYTYGGHVALKICPLYNVALSHIWSGTFWKPLHICEKYYVEQHCYTYIIAQNCGTLYICTVEKKNADS
jgi:hypothetical protein